jgi:serine/threonine protein kinase
MANLVGKKLGKYELTERLGSGGMAEVYKAHHPILDRYVTIKILHSFLAEGPDFLARFKREARAVASLRHPHIQQIHDFDIEGEQYYMVMEFIDWGTLQTRMLDLARSGAYMPAGQVVSVLKQVAGALDYAHNQGIIHRDIKPSNILLDSAGNAFLADFGIARMLSDTQFTATGSLIGTPTYMSPEQGKGEHLTPVSDIYSLGIILYELMTGKVPFTSETTPLAIIHKHISEPPPNPGSLRPDLPGAVEEVILKALAKAPQERYESAGEMVRALEKALPPEAIAALDSSETKHAASVSTLPTMRVDELSAADRARLPTVAMQEQALPEKIEPAQMRKAVQPEPGGMDKSALEKRETSAPPTEEPERNLPAKRSHLSLWKRLKSRPILLGGIGIGLVVVVVLLILAFSGAFRGASCPTIQECQAQAEQLRTQGDLGGYIKYIDRALGLVHSLDNPGFAGLWCDRGDVEKQMGQIDEARNSYTNCSTWTQGKPELQPVRDRAQAGLGNLP